MAGWNDDDWEEDAVQAKPTAKAAAWSDVFEDEGDGPPPKAGCEWSDDDWEDPAPAPKRKDSAPAPKGKDKDFEPPNCRKAAAEHEETVKIVSKDSMKDLTLNFQKDVKQMVSLVTPKLKAAEAKKAQVKFLTDTLNALRIYLTMAECEALQKLIKASIKQRQAEKEEEAEDSKAKAEKEAKFGKHEVDEEDFFAIS